MKSKLFPVIHIAGIAVFSLALSSCSVTETINKVLSSTTPGDWYTEDGLPKAEYKVKMFVAINLENLKADLARGQGEYLTSLSMLLNVPPQHKAQFFALAQRQYPALAQQDKTVTGEMLIALSHEMGGGLSVRQ
jgi:hypothetical protein